MLKPPTITDSSETAPKKIGGSLPWHSFRIEEVLRLLEVDIKTGLSTLEAKRRQEKLGRNCIPAKQGPSCWLHFLQQFNQPLVYILLLAGAVTAVLGEWTDSSVIFGVTLLNAIAGFIQEGKAEKAIEALSSMVATQTSVRWDGQKQRVHSGVLTLFVSSYRADAFRLL